MLSQIDAIGYALVSQRLTTAQARRAGAQAHLELAQRDEHDAQAGADAAVLALRKKYQLTEGDGFNYVNGQITRAPVSPTNGAPVEPPATDPAPASEPSKAPKGANGAPTHVP
jgi:hypothetical protein